MNLKILQWNVWDSEAPERVGRAIRSFDVDIVLAQELVENKNTKPDLDSVAMIAQILGWNHIYQIAETWDTKAHKTSQGNAIFSRFPIRSSRHVFVQRPHHNPIDYTKEGRVYLEAEVDVNTYSITVGTTHLSFIPQFKETVSRSTETDRLVYELTKSRRCYIFGGDLNATPDSKTVEKVLDYLESCGPELTQPTFPTKPFNKHGTMVSRPTWRVDYLFATPDVRVVKAEIVKTEVSDHLPIRVEIEV